MKKNSILNKYADYLKKKEFDLNTFYDLVMDDVFEQKCFKLHDDVNQKYDGNPYSLHLRMVSTYVYSVFTLTNKTHLFGENELNCAEKLHAYFICYYSSLLHDSIEDARMTYNDVKKFCDENIKTRSIYDFEKQVSLKIDGEIVADIVYALTNEKGKNRKERANEKYYNGIRENKYAIIVKICDRLANMTYSCLMGSKMASVYESELESFINSVIPEDNIKFKYGVQKMFNNIKVLKENYE